jgi:hypothetical protein
MGDKESIETKAADNIQEYIKAEVKNGALKIYIEKGINIKNSKVDIYIIAFNL